MSIKQAIEALEGLIEEKADYMRRNKLGDAYREHATKQGIAAIAALRSMPAEPVEKVELFTNDHMKRLYEAAKADPRTKAMTDENWFVMGCAMAEHHIRSFSSPFTLHTAPVLSDAEIEEVVSSMMVTQDGYVRFSASLRDFARAIEQAVIARGVAK